MRDNFIIRGSTYSTSDENIGNRDELHLLHTLGTEQKNPLLPTLIVIHDNKGNLLSIMLRFRWFPILICTQ